jgi:hypothetical protein
MLLLMSLVFGSSAMGLRREPVAMIGGSMVATGVALLIVFMLIDPWLLVLWFMVGMPWFIAVGLAFPWCVRVVQHFSDRPRTRPKAAGSAQT